MKTILEERDELAAQVKELNEKLSKATETAKSEVSEATKKLESGLKAATDEIQTLKDANAELKLKVDSRDQAIETQKQEIEKLKSEAKTVEQKAAEIAAGAGQPPIAGDSQSNEELDDIRQQIRTEKDPLKKAELARKAREARGHAGMFSNPIARN